MIDVNHFGEPLVESRPVNPFHSFPLRRTTQKDVIGTVISLSRLEVETAVQQQQQRSVDNGHCSDTHGTICPAAKAETAGTMLFNSPFSQRKLNVSSINGVG